MSVQCPLKQVFRGKKKKKKKGRYEIKCQKRIAPQEKKMPQENNPAHQDLQWMEKKNFNNR